MIPTIETIATIATIDTIATIACMDTRDNCYGESQGKLTTTISHTGPLCASNTKRGVTGQRDKNHRCSEILLQGMKSWVCQSFANLNKDLKLLLSYDIWSNVLHMR